MKRQIHSQYRQMRSQTAHLAIAAAISLLMAFGLSGCSNEDSVGLADSDPSHSGEATLVLPSDIEVTEFDSTPMTRANGDIEKETASFNVDDNQGVIIDTGKGGVSDHPTSPQTRAFNMNTGVHYRVVIYKSSESTIYKQYEFIAGTATPISGGSSITLAAGSYDIYAYSFNKAEAISELSLTSDISVKDGDDFMSTNKITQTILAKQMGTTINLSQLTFQRRCCNVWVKVESIAYDDTAINDCNVTLGKVPVSATWNLKSSSSFSGVSGETTWSAISNKSSGKNTPITASHIMIPKSSLSLSLPTATFNTNKNGSKGVKEFSFSGSSVPSISFASGSQYLISIKGLGAYVLTTPGPVIIGGKKWSAYNSRSGGGFESYPEDSEYYFTFSDAQYACPAGWHVPSEDEFNVLPSKVIPKNSAITLYNKIYQIDNNFGFFGSTKTTFSGTIFKDGNQILCLPAAGYRESGSGLGGAINVKSYCMYWSSTPEITIWKKSFSSSSTMCGTGSQDMSRGMSVRCVQ